MMHVCRHTTLGELHVYTGLVSKTTSLRINMSCVSCSLQASPHKYDVTTLPIDMVFCHGYKSHSIKQGIFTLYNVQCTWHGDPTHNTYPVNAIANQSTILTMLL